MIARVNGVALDTAQETLTAEDLRQRACTELLRQAAQRAGLLDAADAPAADGATSEAATGAIEALLERELNLPEPSEEACRRHHAAHESAYRTGERVRVRHILFAVTPGVDVAALFANLAQKRGTGDAAGNGSSTPAAVGAGSLAYLSGPAGRIKLAAPPCSKHGIRKPWPQSPNFLPRTIPTPSRRRNGSMPSRRCWSAKVPTARTTFSSA